MRERLEEVTQTEWQDTVFPEGIETRVQSPATDVVARISYYSPGHEVDARLMVSDGRRDAITLDQMNKQHDTERDVLLTVEAACWCFEETLREYAEALRRDADTLFAEGP